MNIFADKVAIVTGGASGIGRGIVEALAARGAKVVIADINGKLAEDVAASITRAGGTVKAASLDVTKFDAVKALVDSTVAEYGRLDYMFNNAGVALFSEARDCCYADWRRVVDVDFLGPVNGVAAVYPLMVKQGFGHIVNTASLAGLVPAAHLVSYTSCKHGVVGLSHSLRLEGAGLGVKVSVVCPGLIQTPMYDSPTIKLDKKKLIDGAPKGMPPEKCARVILKGVERNKATILVTPLAKVAYILYRISPNAMLWLGEKFVKNARKNLRVED